MTTGTGAVGERATPLVGDRAARPGPGRRMTLSLRNRLALVFSAITFLALAALYVYVAPGLQTRLLSDQLAELKTDASHHTAQIAKTVGSADPLAVVQNHVNAAALATGDRVTLLLVNHVPSGAVLSELADSSRRSATAALSFGVAKRAIASGEDGHRAPRGRRRGRSPRRRTRSRSAVGWRRSSSTPRRPRTSSARSRPSATRSWSRAGSRCCSRSSASYLIARALAQRVKRLELRRRAGRGGRFRAPDPGRLGRRARPARGGVQRDAAPALPARVRPQEVHRDRVARAAHPDLLARRIRRAARGRGSRSGDAGAVPGAGQGAGRAAAQAVGRPARSVPARVGVARAAARAGRPRAS